MRVFIAIDFEEEVKDYLDGIQNIIKENSRLGNFTQKENYHITIRFMGEVNKSDIDMLIEAMNDAAVRNKSFNINLNKLGAFPKGNTSIVWVGIDKSNPLTRLYLSLEKALEKQGFRRDKKAYTPHITLGREVAVNGNPNNLFKQMDKIEKDVSVSKITLMESKRIGAKLVYYPIYVSSLK